MKQVKIILVLTIVALFAAGILSLADLLSREKIEENQKKAINEAIARIEPRTESVGSKDGLYEIFDKEKNLLGFVFLAEGRGYQGTIKILCGVSASLDELLGIEIIESKETPGLGAKISRDGFKGQFRRLNIIGDIEYTKSKPAKENQIQAITGATVSSKSVVNILNNRIAQIKELIKKK